MKKLLSQSDYHQLLSTIREGICHGHLWIRMVCLRIIQLYNSWYDNVHEIYSDVINLKSKLLYERSDELFFMIRNLQSALESEIMTEEYGSLCVENLLYVTKLVLYHPQLAISSQFNKDENDEENNNNNIDPFNSLMNRFSRLGCRGNHLTKKLIFGYFYTILTTEDIKRIKKYVV